MRRVALLDPLGDAGIGGYTHELAQALVRAGVSVDLYSVRRAFAERLPRGYALVSVFGGPALARADIEARCVTARAAVALPLQPSPGDATPDVLDRYFDVLDRRQATRQSGVIASPPASSRPSIRRDISMFEHRGALAEHLCAADYDTIWTQWPDVSPYDSAIGERCARTRQG